MVGKGTRLARHISSGIALLVLLACGGTSKTRTRALVEPAGGGSAGDESCTVGSAVYRSGETFGACNECTCQDGHTRCLLILCVPEAGAGGGGAGAGEAGAPVGGGGV
jgi:hypothetical protein